MKKYFILSTIALLCMNWSTAFAGGSTQSSPTSSIPTPSVNPKAAISAVQHFGNKALDITKTTGEAAQASFHVLIEEAMDVRAICEFIFGPVWKKANDGQKGTLVRLYEDVLVVTNIKRFTEYAGATFEVKSNTVPRPKGIGVYATIKVPSKPDIEIQLTLIQTPDGPKIINIAVEGFVLLVNEREQWKNVIKDVNIDVGEFINKLTTHIAKIKEHNAKTS